MWTKENDMRGDECKLFDRTEVSGPNFFWLRKI